MFSQFRAVKTLGWRSILSVRKLKHLSQETIRGFYTTRTLIALLNIGLLDELAGRPSVNLKTFAAERELDLNVLRILCDYLFSLKILNRDGENYRLDAKGKMIAEMLLGAYYAVYAYEDVLYHLEALLKKDKKYGADVRRRSEFVAKGSGAMGKLLAFPLVATVIKSSGFTRVLDLGCGDATFLIDMCESEGSLTGYGLDISVEAIAAGQRNLAQENLQKRIELVVGDIFEIDVLVDRFQEVEVATCIYVLHEFQDRIPEILCGFRRGLPGVPLIICEVIRHTPEELRQKPGGLLEIQLFHNLSQQQLYSREEWHTFFKQAGFMNVKEDYLGFVKTAIYTVS